MTVYVIYLTASGLILRWGVCDSADYAIQFITTGESITQFAFGTQVDISSQYISAGTLTTRPSMPITVTGGTISGLPNPSLVSYIPNSGGILPGEITVTDGTLTISAPTGSYEINVTSGIYQDYSTDISI